MENDSSQTQDVVTHELLRELLNETREIRRNLQFQTEFLETAAFYLQEGASDASRERYKTKLSSRKREAGKHYRRILSTQRPLTDWLNRKGLEVTHFTDDGLETGPADEIAEWLGADFAILGGFLKALVTSTGHREGFSFGLDEFEEPDGRTLSAFAQRIEDLGLVKAMNISGGQIHVEPLLDQGLHKFISGGWLERAVYNLVIRISPEKWSPKRILANAVARDSKNQASIYEFDLLLPLEPENPNEVPVILLDPKTGALTPKAVQKIRRNVARVGLPPERYVVVRPSADSVDLKTWQEALPEVSVVGFPDLRAFLD